MPQGIQDRGSGDAVPSLDWHAAAGKGATLLGKEAVNQELATPVSGNASKVSVDTAVRRVYTQTRADTSSLCSLLGLLSDPDCHNHG